METFDAIRTRRKINEYVETPPYVDMYFDGGFNLDSMVSKTISLEDVNEGFEEMKTGAIART